MAQPSVRHNSWRASTYRRLFDAPRFPFPLPLVCRSFSLGKGCDARLLTSLIRGDRRSRVFPTKLPFKTFFTETILQSPQQIGLPNECHFCMKKSYKFSRMATSWCDGDTGSLQRLSWYKDLLFLETRNKKNLGIAPAFNALCGEMCCFKPSTICIILRNTNNPSAFDLGAHPAATRFVYSSSLARASYPTIEEEEKRNEEERAKALRDRKSVV